jgi:hypothetical protein
MMLDLGADNYDRAIAFSARRGHKEIVQIIKNYSENF